MRLAVVGSRTFTDREMMLTALEAWNQPYEGDLSIVSGGARGADTIAEMLSEYLDIPFVIYPADWQLHGKAAGFIRNRKIVEESDALLAFYGPTIVGYDADKKPILEYGNESAGTAHSVSLARERGIPVSVHFQERKEDE